MSLQDVRVKLETELNNIYEALEEQGATIPEKKNLVNVAPTIEKINSSSGILELEYIESSGTQFVDVGVTASQNIKVEINFENLETSKSTHIFGSRTGVQNAAINMAYKQEAGARGYSFAWGNEVEDTNNTVADAKVYILGNNKAYINNNLIHTFTSQTFSNNFSMYLFTCNNGGVPHTQYSTIKLFYCKIYDGNVLVRDLKPVLDENYTPCLYDSIEEKYYYNKGAGEFISGKVIGEIEKKQVHNYLMLYDGTLGEAGENGANVCKDVTGGFSLMISSGNAGLTYNSNNMLIENYGTSSIDNTAVMVNDAINLSEYKTLAGISIPDTDNYISSALVVRNIKGYGNAGLSGSTGISTSTDNSTVSNTQSSEFIGKKFIYDSDVSNISSGYPYFAHYSQYNSHATNTIYSMFLVKKDDYQSVLDLAGITTTYTDEASICANQTAMTTILNNKEAIDYMVHNCTGTFMVAFLQSQTALNALNSSPYKVLVYQNDVWIKFLSMVA